MLNREGRWYGNVTQLEVGQSESGFVFVDIAMDADGFKAKGGQYEKLDPPVPGRGKFFITGKDGLVKVHVDNIREVFGITSNPEYLVDDLKKLDFAATPTRASMTVREEQYNGETRFDVCFINKVGGIAKATPEQVDAAKSEWRRVLGGGSPREKKASPAPAQGQGQLPSSDDAW